jgi:hypothetical protein
MKVILANGVVPYLVGGFINQRNYATGRFTNISHIYSNLPF